MGCPIRIPTDQRLLAAPHGFSQRATSFIASWCQGIHRMPFSCSPLTIPADRHLATHGSQRRRNPSLAAPPARHEVSTLHTHTHIPEPDPDGRQPAQTRRLPVRQCHPARPGTHQILIHTRKDHPRPAPSRASPDTAAPQTGSPGPRTRDMTGPSRGNTRRRKRPDATNAQTPATPTRQRQPMRPRRCGQGDAAPGGWR